MAKTKIAPGETTWKRRCGDLIDVASGDRQWLCSYKATVYGKAVFICKRVNPGCAADWIVTIDDKYWASFQRLSGAKRMVIEHLARQADAGWCAAMQAAGH